MATLIDADTLRYMTVAECSGHSIEYAMGWKTCVDWIKTLPTVDAAPEPAKVQVSPLLFYLALYAPAPEYAPDDWTHHVEENLAAWDRFVREAQERGYYEFPIDDSPTCGPDYCEIGGEDHADG